METVTISKKEYEEILNKSLDFDYLHYMLENNVFSPPPKKNVKEVITAFRKTNLYNEKFLVLLERGLKRSKTFKSR